MRHLLILITIYNLLLPSFNCIDEKNSDLYFDDADAFAEIDTRPFSCRASVLNSNYSEKDSYLEFQFDVLIRQESGILLSGISVNSTSIARHNHNETRVLDNSLGFIIYFKRPHVVLNISRLHDGVVRLKLEHLVGIFSLPWHGWHKIKLKFYTNKWQEESVVFSFDSQTRKQAFPSGNIIFPGPDSFIGNMRNELFLGYPPPFTYSRLVVSNMYNSDHSSDNIYSTENPDIDQINHSDPFSINKTTVGPYFEGRIQSFGIRSSCVCSTDEFGPKFIWHGPGLKWNSLCDNRQVDLLYHKEETACHSKDSLMPSELPCTCSKDNECKCPKFKNCLQSILTHEDVFDTLSESEDKFNVFSREKPPQSDEFKLVDPKYYDWKYGRYALVRNSKNESERISLKVHLNRNQDSVQNFKNLNCFTNLFLCQENWRLSFKILLLSDLHVNQYGEDIRLFSYSSQPDSHFGLFLNYSTNMISIDSSNQQSHHIHVHFQNPNNFLWDIRRPLRLFPGIWHSVQIDFVNRTLLLDVDGNRIGESTVYQSFEYPNDRTIKNPRDTAMIQFGGSDKKHDRYLSTLVSSLRFSSGKFVIEEDFSSNQIIPKCAASRLSHQENSLVFYNINADRNINYQSQLLTATTNSLSLRQGLFLRIQVKRPSFTYANTERQLLARSSIFVIETKTVDYKPIFILSYRNYSIEFSSNESLQSIENQIDIEIMHTNEKLEDNFKIWLNSKQLIWKKVYEIRSEYSPDEENFEIFLNDKNNLFQLSNKLLLCFAERQLLTDLDYLVDENSTFYEPDIPYMQDMEEKGEFKHTLPPGCMSLLELCSHGQLIQFWMTIEAKSESIINSSWTAYDSTNPLTKSGITVLVNLLKWHDNFPILEIEIQAKTPSSIGYDGNNLVYRLNSWTIKRTYEIKALYERIRYLFKISWSRLWGLEASINDELLGTMVDSRVIFIKETVKDLGSNKDFTDLVTEFFIGNYKNNQIARYKREQIFFNRRRKSNVIDFNVRDLRIFDAPGFEPSVGKFLNSKLGMRRLVGFYPWINSRNTILMPTRNRRYASLISLKQGLCLNMRQMPEYHDYTIRMKLEIPSFSQNMMPIINLPNFLRLIAQKDRVVVILSNKQLFRANIGAFDSLENVHLMEVGLNVTHLKIFLDRRIIVEENHSFSFKNLTIGNQVIVGNNCQSDEKRYLKSFCSDSFILHWLEIWNVPHEILRRIGAIETD